MRGGNGLEIADALLEGNRPILGFLDDNAARWGREWAGVPVLGPLGSWVEYTGAVFVFAIGNPGNYRERRGICEGLGVPLERFEPVVHPAAQVSRLAVVGRGGVILANASIAAGARIGNHVLVLSNASVGHETVVGDYSCVCQGAQVPGRVRMGESVYVGTGAAVRNDVALGEGCQVGMGAVVLRDVAPGAVVVGNPARVL